MAHQQRYVALRHYSNAYDVSVAADASLREVGLNLAVATMRKGERCHLRVRPEYGYGDRGDWFPFQQRFASEHCSDVSLERLYFLIWGLRCKHEHLSCWSFMGLQLLEMKFTSLRLCMCRDGCAGSFSFPAVPPCAELEYELELLDFDPADEVLCHTVCIPSPW